MSTLRHNYLINLKGNVSTKSREFGNNVDKMSRRHERSMRNMSSSSRRMTRNVDSSFRRMSRGIGTSMMANRQQVERFGRYAAGILTVAGGMAIKKVADLEERITQLGINAGKNGDELVAWSENIKGAIGNAAQEWSIGTDQIAGAMDQIIEKTGNSKFAVANLDTLTKAMRASGAAGVDMGKIASEIEKMPEEMRDPKMVSNLVDIMVAQGQMGAFTLKDQARLSTPIYASYAPTNELENRQMGAILQTIQRGSSGAEGTVTALQALLRTFNDNVKVKKLRAMGIQVFEPEQLKKGIEKVRPLTDLLVEIIIATNGKMTEISKIFDSEAQVGFKDLKKQFDLGVDIRKSLDDIIHVDAQDAALKDANDAKKGLNASITKASEAVFHALEKDLSGVVRGLAEFVNALDEDEMKLFIAAIETATVALLVMAGLSVLGKIGGGAARAVKGTARAAKGVKKIFKRGGKPSKVPAISKAGTLGGYTSPVIPKSASTISKVLRTTGNVASKAALPLTIGVAAIETANVVMDDSKNTNQKLDAGVEIAGGLGGAALGAKGGAIAGAALGSFVPVLGTAIGAALGTVIGGVGGYFAGSYAGDKAGDAIFSPEKEAVTIKQTVDATTASIAQSQTKMLQAMPLPTANDVTAMMDANSSKTANQTAATIATALANNPGSLTVHVTAGGGASASIGDIKSPTRMKINAGSTTSRLTER